jgi:hypothetical protein
MIKLIIGIFSLAMFIFFSFCSIIDPKGKLDTTDIHKNTNHALMCLIVAAICFS